MSRGFPRRGSASSCLVFFVGFACGIFISGRLIRRMGHIRTFAFCAAVCASIALLHSLWVDPWAWMALRFLYGLSLVTLMTVTESWLNARAEKHERGRVFAMYMVVNLGGIALAQQLLRLSPGELLVLFSVSAILSCWALLPITISSRSQPHIPERAKSSLKKIIGFAPLAVATSALSGLAMGAFWAMAPLYASKLGFGLSEVGLLMSLTIVGAALAPLLVGLIMNLVGPQGMPVYMAVVLGLLATYAIYQVRHVSVLTAGEQAHFEPMAQSSHEIVEMIER